MSREYEQLVAMGCSEDQANFAQAVANFGLESIASKGSLNMHALIMGGTDEDTGRAALIVLEAPRIGDHNKDMFFETVRYVTYMSEAEAAAVTSETWMPPKGISAEEQARLFEEHGSISQFPDKREGVIVAITDKNANKLLITYDLVRDADGNIAEIKPEAVDFGDKDAPMSGRLFSTFYSGADRLNANFAQRLKVMEQYVQMATAPKDAEDAGIKPPTYN